MASKDYKNGKIYCIRNTKDDDIYVGSTCQPLSKRMAKHRADIKWKPYKLYAKMIEIGVEHFYIELIEDCPCDNVEQLRMREGHFIREIGTLNMAIAGRSKQEWYEANKEELLQRGKQRYQENKEAIEAQQREYRKQHAEELRAYFKQYAANNKDKILAWKSTPNQCECGGRYVNSSKAQHLKSKLHQNYINSQQNPQD